jgi:hypothetical protein
MKTTVYRPLIKVLKWQKKKKKKTYHQEMPRQELKAIPVRFTHNKQGPTMHTLDEQSI